MTPENLLLNHITTHMLTQNQQAKSKIGCAYRTDDGLMCAIGCTIDDSIYVPELEGHGIRSITGNGGDDFYVSAHCKVVFEEFTQKYKASLLARFNYDLDEHGVNFLVHVQNQHDCFSPNNWPFALMSMYRQFRLIPPDVLIDKLASLL